MKENKISFEKSREIIDALLVQLECALFSKHSGLEISEEELEKIITIAKKLVEFDEEYSMMSEESKIMWLKIQQLEEENKNLRGVKNGG